MSEPTLPSYILAFHPRDRRRKPEIYPFNSEREALRAKREWERDWETDETLVIWRVTAEAVGHDE